MSEELEKLYEEERILRKKIKAEEDKVFMRKGARPKDGLIQSTDEPICHSKVISELSCHSIQCH